MENWIIGEKEAIGSKSNTESVGKMTTTMTAGRRTWKKMISLLDKDYYRTFTCKICLTRKRRTDLFKNSSCSHREHLYCTGCIVQYITSKVDPTTTRTGSIKCPSPCCGATLDPDSCRGLLPRSVFVQWCDALCEAYILGFPKIHCPNPNCSVPVVDDCDCGRRQVPVRKARCLICKTAFCFQCKRSWHGGVDCKFSSWLENDDDDRVFCALAERQGWRLCPRCGRCIEKNDGCTRMTCRCGCSFCYTCGEKTCKCLRRW